VLLLTLPTKKLVDSWDNTSYSSTSISIGYVSFYRYSTNKQCSKRISNY